MTKLDRRGFLKALGVFLAGLIFPGRLGNSNEKTKAPSKGPHKEARFYKAADRLAG